MSPFPSDAPSSVAVDDLAWIAGTWRGTIGEDLVDEIWTEPSGETMMGMFRWVRQGKTLFYELIALEPNGEGVSMRLRHFSPGAEMRGWEDPELPMEFVLVEHGENYAVFRHYDDPTTLLTYTRAPEDRLTVAFVSTVGQPLIDKPFLFSKI